MGQTKKRVFFLCLTVIIILTILPCAYAKSYTQEELETIELTTEYSSVGPFLNRVARVNKDGRYGFINENGLEVIPIEYLYAGNFSDGLALIRTFNGYAYIDNRGNEIISTNYPLDYNFSDGLSKIMINNKTVFIDKTGKEVFNLAEGFADNFSEGMSRFLNGSSAPSDGFVINTGKWGFLDKNGKLAIPAIYANVNGFSEGLAGVYKNSNGRSLSGFIDKTGKIVIPIKYNYVRYFNEGLAWVEKVDGGEAFIDKTGREVISLDDYDEVKNFSEGLALVAKDIDDNYSTGHYGIDKYGFIDKSGKLIIPLIYDSANSFSEGLALVKKDGKYGYIDKTGEVVIPLIYDDAQVFSQGSAWVKKDDKQMIIRNPILLELASKKQAIPTKSQVFVNGKKIDFDAYLIDNNNYFKLRDIAKVLSDTKSQFDVVWDKEKNDITLNLGMPYTMVGSELAKGDGVPRIGLLSKSKIYINGIDVSIAGYVINGNNYFKLRELGHFLKFDVYWDDINKNVQINTK
ncbi:WG repeat-containing protein [Tissierella sp.]|uniref:WG repeat-containing protein n=1 Tax=Tissierella sp. TaxID=41274 RepID=UPI002856ACD1|nr:WG repeat-containing protein [Tissierella sp.]MDR7855952.1 WG repeat-containing protein [Tissierella sp.]